MIKLWKFTLFFLLCLVIALLLNLPIQQVLPHMKLPDTVRLSGIKGTVIRGRAQQISIDGFPARAVEYHLIPSCIPSLKACYKINYEQGVVQIAYDALNGDIEISKARIQYPVMELVNYLPDLLINPAGRVELVIEELSLVQGKPTTLFGTLTWRDLALDDNDIRIDLGDYQVEFTGDQKKYKFRVKDLNAALDVTGNSEIKVDGQYSVDIKIGSDTSIDPNVKSVLDLVAARSGYNKYRIEQKGRLPANVIRQIF